MTISYSQAQGPAPRQDGANQVIREAAEYFEGERVQLTTAAGLSEIISSAPLFEQYKTRLTEGCTANDAAQLEQLLENTRVHILQESAIAGIQQVSALSMPMIRKAWPRIGMKQAIPTEAVKSPQFAITYLEPFLVKQDGSKLPLPKALRDPLTQGDVLKKKAVNAAFIPLPNDAAGVNLITSTAGASLAAGDTIDPVFFITQATIMVVPIPAGPAVPVNVNVRIERDVNDRFFGTVTGTEVGGGTATDTLTGAIDRQTGVFTLSSVRGLVTQVKVTGFITDENNTHGDEVTFEIKKKDIVIGTGAHVNAGLPIEWLTDNMAVYSIDSAMKVIDIISMVQAQKVDQEILAFVDQSFVTNAQPYAKNFNVFPSAQYTGSPTEWRSEIRTVIDWLATKMKLDSSFTNSKFVLAGNPLDLQLIPNVEWTFTAAAEERSGVDVAYNLGAYAGSNSYSILSSDNIPQGKIRMLLIPNVADWMTFKYYPYAFNVEANYRNPRTPNIPNIMVTRRDRVEELVPVSAELSVLQNDGTLARTFTV